MHDNEAPARDADERQRRGCAGADGAKGHGAPHRPLCSALPLAASGLHGRNLRRVADDADPAAAVSLHH